jgi:hypothetical protein
MTVFCSTSQHTLTHLCRSRKKSEFLKYGVLNPFGWWFASLRGKQTANPCYSERFTLHRMDSEAAASTGLANAQLAEAQPIAGNKRKACDEQADDAAKSAVDAAFSNDKPKLVLLLNKYWDQKSFEKMLTGAGVTASDYNKCKKVSGNTVGTLLFETTEQLERVQVLSQLQ